MLVVHALYRCIAEVSSGESWWLVLVIDCLAWIHSPLAPSNHSKKKEGNYEMKGMSKKKQKK